MLPEGETEPRGPEPVGVWAAANIDIHAEPGGVGAGIINGDVTNTVTHVYAARSEVTWPHTVGLIPQRAQSFQNRAALRELETYVERETSAPCLVLDGLGGIGKTQLAAFYARRALKNKEIELLVWVNAAARDSITFWLAEAAIDLRGADPAKREQAAKVFLAWLQSQRGPTGRRWLLVFDDLADPNDLPDLPLPFDSGSNGRILITTRRQDASLDGEGYHHVDVGLFTPDEAHDYLIRSLASYGRDDDAAELRKLAGDLGNLPLALSQAAAFMVEYGLSAADYRLLFATARDQLGKLFSKRDGYEFTVATTWTVSVEAANGLYPRGLSRPVLTLASVLDPDGIPEALFTTEAARRFLADSAPDRETPEVTADHARHALKCLQRLSLISIGSAADNSEIGVHSLVQRTSIAQAGESEVGNAVLAAADALMEIWPLGDTSPVYRQLVRQNALNLARTHFDRLWEPGHGHHELWEPEDGHHEILTAAGRALGDAGQPAEAIAFFDRLADASKDRLGPSHLSTLRARANAASYRGHAGNPRAAARALEGVLSDLTQLFSPEHPVALNVRGRLASWQGRAGDLPGAIRALEELCEVQRRLLPESDETFRTRASLASFRGQAGDSAAAAQAYQELLADEERVHGTSHPNVLETRRNLVKYLYPDAPTAAVRALRQLETDHEQVLSSDHPDTLSVRFILAQALARAGDYPRAAAALTELLADRERVLGPDHPATLATRYRLHLIRQQARQSSKLESADRLRELLEDQVRVLGHDHPDTLRTRGLMLSWQKPRRPRPEAAAQTTLAFEELLSDQRRVLGREDHATQNTQRDLALWRGHADDPAGAARDFAQLLADYKEIYGADHPRTLSAMSELHRWLSVAGDYHQAAKTARALYDVQASMNGVDDPRTLRTFSSLIDNERKAASRDGLVDAFSEQIRHQTEEKGAEHPDTLRTRTRLAWELLRAGYAKRARQELDDLIPVLTRVLGSENELTLRARFDLACYYDTAGYRKRAGHELKAVLRDQRRYLSKKHPELRKTEDALRYWRHGKPVVLRPPVTGASQATSPGLHSAAPRRPVKHSPGHAAASDHEAVSEGIASTAGLLAAIGEMEPLSDGYLEDRLHLTKLDAQTALDARRWLRVALTRPGGMVDGTAIGLQYADALTGVLVILGRAGIMTLHSAVRLWLLRNHPELASYELENMANKLVNPVCAAIARNLHLGGQLTLPPLDAPLGQDAQPGHDSQPGHHPQPGQDFEENRTMRSLTYQVVGLMSTLRLQSALEDILTTAIELAAKAVDPGGDAQGAEPAAASRTSEASAASAAFEEPDRPVLPRAVILAADSLAHTFGLPYGTSALRQALVHRSWQPAPGKPVPSRFTNTALGMAGASVVNALVACGIAQSVIARPTTLDLRSLLWSGDNASSFSTVFDTLALGKMLLSGENGDRLAHLDDRDKALSARAVLTAACVSREADLLILPESLPGCVRDWLALVVQNPVAAGQSDQPENGTAPPRELHERAFHLYTVSPGQALTLGEGISVEVSQVDGENTRLRFQAPNDVLILRRELWERRRMAK